METNGYWTPKITLGYGGEVGNYDNQSGSYSRQDSQVQCWARVGPGSDLGSETGDMLIEGLPFPVRNGVGNIPVTIFPYDIIQVAGTTTRGYVAPNWSVIAVQNFIKGNPCTLANFKHTDLRARCYFDIGLIYNTDSPFNAADIVIKGDSMGSGDHVNGKNTNAWNGLTESSIPKTIEVNAYPGFQIGFFNLQQRDWRDFNNRDAVVLFLGYNDLKGSDSVATIKAKYQELYDQLDSDNIICIAVPPLNISKYTTEFGSAPPSGINAKISDFNDEVKLICGASKFIDTYSEFKDTNDECEDQYTIDGLHPSQLAYDWISSQILFKL